MPYHHFLGIGGRFFFQGVLFMDNGGKYTRSAISWNRRARPLIIALSILLNKRFLTWD